MLNDRKTANKLEDIKEKAILYREIKLNYFEKIRYHCDKLEIKVSDELWPLTKYREILFSFKS